MTRKILFPTDGSAHALRALQQWVAQQAAQPAAPDLEIHLLSVQLPVDGNVRTFVSADELNAYHRAEGEAALQTARDWLHEGGLAHQHHILVGHPADLICRFAQERGMDEIVMGSHGRTGLLELLMGSVATEVQARATVPVTVVRPA